MSNIKEHWVEQYLVDRVEANGGVAVKVVSPGRRGFFDRIVVLNGDVAFVETKKPKGGRVSPQQRQLHERFRMAGAHVEVVKTREEVDILVEALIGEFPSANDAQYHRVGRLHEIGKTPVIIAETTGLDLLTVRAILKRILVICH